MRVFVSAGEPSGDLHGSNFIRALRQRQPDLEVHGFGGERMAEAGCKLLYPLSELALVGFVRIFAFVPQLLRLLRQADTLFREQRPDAVVLIDYPGFHWWLARRARAHGIPVYYFVPPQLWAWAPWRIRKMRRNVNHVLCPFPFEEEWYRARNVPVTCIGHPYFDELRGQRLDAAFVAAQRSQPGTRIALLPGSRDQEFRYCLQSLLRAAEIIHQRRPDVRFLAACLRPEHAHKVEAEARGRGLPLEVHHGRTPEIIHLAHSCVAVSGSVSLELLFRGKPSVILYRQHWLSVSTARVVMTCPYICLVNLLAGKMLYPEYLRIGCPAKELAGHVLHWLEDRVAYEALCGELSALSQRIALPGACDRAADHVLALLRGTAPLRAA